MRLTSADLDPDVLGAIPDGPLAVAVSGGSDSMALLHLLKEWGARRLFAVTVDHGLRPDSAAEAISVATSARALKIPHATLKWEGWDGRGNLQDKARTARRELIANWARRRAIPAVALGHTADDQAETFLMRLARGSGLDGLASMEGVTEADGIIWVRPLLTLRRDDLRRFLTTAGINWIDDPSNDDPAFDRVRMRTALKSLSEEGIDVPRIVATTKRLQSAKQVLFTATRDLAEAAARMHPAGDLTIDLTRFLPAAQAVRLRLFSEALRHVSASYYAPRAYQCETIMDDLAKERFADQAVHGCLIRQKGETLAIRREPARVGPPVAFGQIWDDRWRLTGLVENDATIAALGESGLAQRPNWRNSGLSRETLMTTPAVFRGETLVAAPLVDKNSPFTAELTAKSVFFMPRQS